MNAKLFKKIKSFTIGWLVALIIWRLISKFSIRTFTKFLNLELSSFELFIFILIISIITGLIFGSIQYYYEKFQIKRKSFKVLLLNALVTHILIMIIIYLLIFMCLRLLNVGNNLRFIDFLKDPLTMINLTYSILVNSFIIVIIEVNKLLGKGNLGRLITGKFYNPQEEFRIFMFLDLNRQLPLPKNWDMYNIADSYRIVFSTYLLSKNIKWRSINMLAMK